MSILKQYEIAEKLGISESVLSRIISGKRKPSPIVAKSLSILTSSDLETWLFESEKKLFQRQQLIKKVDAGDMAKVFEDMTAA